MQTAKQLRRNIFWLVLLLFWNAMADIIVMLVALLLSYLIENGAYLQEQADETARIQEQVTVSLTEITENKSGPTGQHVRCAAEYTRVPAEELGYPADQLDDVRLAATMHDIGKLLVSPEIFEKPGRLTDEEFAMIKRHTTDGGRLPENVDGDVMRLSRTIALDHHERWGGNGYARELLTTTSASRVASSRSPTHHRADLTQCLEDAINRMIDGRSTEFPNHSQVRMRLSSSS